MLSLLLILSCSERGPAGPYTSSPRCYWTSYPLSADADADTGFGVTFGQVLAAVTGPRSVPLTWDDTGQTALLTAELVQDGDPVLMKAEVKGDETVDPATICPSSYIEVPVLWSAYTSDGVLEVEEMADARVYGADTVGFSVKIPYGEIGGSLTVDVDPDEWDSVYFTIEVRTSQEQLGLGGSDGSLFVHARRARPASETDGYEIKETYVAPVARWPSARRVGGEGPTGG